MRTDILTTLQMRYRAEMLAANCNVRTYMEASTGIGEHSDIVESVDAEVKKYNEAKELLSAVSNLIEFYNKKNDDQKKKDAQQNEFLEQAFAKAIAELKPAEEEMVDIDERVNITEDSADSE